MKLINEKYRIILLWDNILFGEKKTGNSKVIEEVIPLYEKGRIKYNQNYGEFLAQFFWVRDILERKNLFDFYEALNDKIIENFYYNKIKIDDNYIGYNREVNIISCINELVCSIVEQLYKTIQIVFNLLKKDVIYVNDITPDIKRKLNLDYLNRGENKLKDYLFEKLKEYCETFSKKLNIFFYKLSNIDCYRENLFDDLMNLINNHISEKIFKEYSLMTVGHLNKKRDRCVSLYEYEKPQNGIKGIVSFSGYLDCSDDQILTFRKQKKRQGFIDIINDIATSLKTTLVTTNQYINIYEYNYNNNKFKIKDNLGHMISNNYNYKNLYSCCERKLFSICDYYKSKNDTLYIKLEPCHLCTLGIIYEKQKQKKFNIFYGIKRPF